MHHTTIVKFRLNSARQTHSNLNKTNEASTSKNKAPTTLLPLCVCVCVFKRAKRFCVRLAASNENFLYERKFFRRLQTFLDTHTHRFTFTIDACKARGKVCVIRALLHFTHVGSAKAQIYMGSLARILTEEWHREREREKKSRGWNVSSNPDALIIQGTQPDKIYTWALLLENVAKAEKRQGYCFLKMQCHKWVSWCFKV